MNITQASFLTICIFTILPTFAIAADIEALEKWGEPLLQPVKIEDERNELMDEEQHLFGIENSRYVKRFKNCSSSILENINTWKKSVHLFAKRQEISESRVFSELPVTEPVNGAIIIIYRFIEDKRLSYFKLLFDSNEKITSKEREQLVYKYNLLDLKTNLNRAIECGTNNQT